jgi:hypothetical protein
MSLHSLKNNKEYIVPNKCIHWTVGKHTLDLKVVFDLNKYEQSKLILPPKQMGICNNWHFELFDKNRTTIFTASWDIRRIKDKLEIIDNINEDIIPFATDNSFSQNLD